MHVSGQGQAAHQRESAEAIDHVVDIKSVARTQLLPHPRQRSIERVSQPVQCQADNHSEQRKPVPRSQHITAPAPICAVNPSTVRWSGPIHRGVRAASHSSARFSCAATQLSCTRRISGNGCACFISSSDARVHLLTKLCHRSENRGLRKRLTVLASSLAQLTCARSEVTLPRIMFWRQCTGDQTLSQSTSTGKSFIPQTCYSGRSSAARAHLRRSVLSSARSDIFRCEYQ